jgi:hypothetical protein
MKRIPVLRSLGVVGFSLALLFPLALNAMENAYLEIVTPGYNAQIVDNNKQNYLQPWRKTADGEQFGAYTVNAQWTFNKAAKIATATCIVKKRGQTILDDTMSITYDTAVLRKLNDEAYLRIFADETPHSDRPLKEIMYEETTTNK